MTQQATVAPGSPHTSGSREPAASGAADPPSVAPLFSSAVDASVVTPVSAVGWDLRTQMALGREVRVVVSDRCDGVRRRRGGERILAGYVSSVAATDAFAIVDDCLVPLEEILVVRQPHFTQEA